MVVSSPVMQAFRERVILPIMEYQRLAPNVISFRMFSDEICEWLMTRSLASDQWAQMHAYKTLSNELPDYPLRRCLFPDRAREVFHVMDEALKQMLRTLVNDCFEDDAPHVNEPHICHYKAGSLFGTHPDAEPGTKLEQVRRYAIVCYLNDGLLGGHTLFPDDNLAVQPKRGHAIMFPSRMLHAGGKVYAGEKLIFLCWMGYKAFQPWKHMPGQPRSDMEPA